MMLSKYTLLAIKKKRLCQLRHRRFHYKNRKTGDYLMNIIFFTSEMLPASN